MAAERSSRATEVAELNKTITGLETACQTLRDRASSLEQTCKALRDEAAAAAAVPAVVTPPTEEIASRDQKIRELEEAIGRLRGSHGDDLKQAAKAAEVRLQQELARATEASQLELTRLRDEYESRERTAAAQYEAQVRSLQSQLQRAQQPSSSPAPSTPAPARPVRIASLCFRGVRFSRTVDTRSSSRYYFLWVLFLFRCSALGRRCFFLFLFVKYDRVAALVACLTFFSVLIPSFFVAIPTTNDIVDCDGRHCQFSRSVFPLSVIGFVLSLSPPLPLLLSLRRPQ